MMSISTRAPTALRVSVCAELTKGANMFHGDECLRLISGLATAGEQLERKYCDERTAKRIANTICRRLKIKKVKVKYSQKTSELAGEYYRSRIEIFHGGHNVDTVLHELAHHIQMQLFRRPLKGGWHNREFCLAYLVVINMYKEIK